MNGGDWCLRSWYDRVFADPDDDGNIFGNTLNGQFVVDFDVSLQNKFPTVFGCLYGKQTCEYDQFYVFYVYMVRNQTRFEWKNHKWVYEW